MSTSSILGNEIFDYPFDQVEGDLMREFINISLSNINGIIWHPYVIVGLLCIGVIFTIWTRFTQFRSLTHGFSIVLGRYGHSNNGSISHFQALSAALSATVGVGNIGGTALAISLGGPGALFWMWIVGFLGMSLKTMEVTISMMHRFTEDGVFRGGPMWVATRGSTGKYNRVGKFLGGLFCITLLIATFTGGLFFQAWNASNVAEQFFGLPAAIGGLILAVIVGLVILGGIQRIGAVAGSIVPLMCGLYLFAAIYVLAVNIDQIPALLSNVVKSAFSGTQASGAFIGGTFGAVFTRGMQQAFFSNESGQGSSPIVHSAAQTDEPVREGIVAGLEPFIDTIVVCTMTGLVILISGVWNRDADFQLADFPEVIQTQQQWELQPTTLSLEQLTNSPATGTRFFCIVQTTNHDGDLRLQQVFGTFEADNLIHWQLISSPNKPDVKDRGVYRSYAGAALTALAFDQAHPGLGRWLVTLATWLFGISTMISWSYYGEQGVAFLVGNSFVMPYRILFCLGIVFSCLGIVTNQTELTHLANLGTGVMLWVNVPITLIFAGSAIAQYNDYFQRIDQSNV